MLMLLRKPKYFSRSCLWWILMLEFVLQQPEITDRWTLFVWFQHLLTVPTRFWDPVFSLVNVNVAEEAKVLFEELSLMVIDARVRSEDTDRWTFFVWFQHLLTVHTQFGDPVFSSVIRCWGNQSTFWGAVFEELSLIVIDARVRPAIIFVDFFQHLLTGETFSEIQSFLHLRVAKESKSDFWQLLMP